MSALHRALLRLRAHLARRRLEGDMQEEMREHLAQATARFVERGLPPGEALDAARREFGNVPLLQEEARDARGGRWLDDLGADLRFALRSFGHRKATTAILVAVLALGIGANALFFSTIQAQFFRPAPAVPADARHAALWGEARPARGAAWAPRGFTQPELLALTGHPEIFRDLAGWTEAEVILRAGDSTGARTVGAQFVTPNFFATLGVPLRAGQGFRQDAGDNTPDLTAVVSFLVAERLYGTAGGAVGRRLLVNEMPVHIVGVAPPRFQGALRNMDEPALWMPVSALAVITRASPRWLLEAPRLSLVARLGPAGAPATATALARQVVLAGLPDSAARVGMARSAQVLPLGATPPGEDGEELRLAFGLMIGVGTLILLVACTSVSSLMVAAAVGRRHEIAVRLSLGASRPRLLRQLLTESTLLALAGGVIGLGLAWIALSYQARSEIDGVDIAPDLGTFAFVFGLALVIGLLFGLSPALHATRDGVATALRDSGTGASSRSRLQRGFVVAQIALSQPLLVLLGTTLSLVLAGYRPVSPAISGQVIAVDFRPLTTGAPGQRPGDVDSLIPRIAARPEVRGAVPDATGFGIRGVLAAERTAGAANGTPAIVVMEGAAPGWFALADVPLLLGRDVAWADTAAASADHAVVIGSDLARSLWGGANPIGRVLVSPALPGLEQDSIALTVVGVYDATARLPGGTWQGVASSGDPLARIYTARGKQWRHDRVLVRTRGPAAPWLPGLQRFLREQAPSLPVVSMQTLAQSDRERYRETLRMSMLAGACGALALLLASLGLYGIVSLAVRQRTREIGIRIAVGARPSQVALMFLGSGVRVSLVALALGLPLSIVALQVALSRGLVIEPTVPPSLIGAVIALILLVVASAATWIPARRASLVEPVTALRTE